MSLTDTFEKRNDLTTIITDEIRNMFCADDVEIIPFGVETISNGNACLDNFIKEKASNETWSSSISQIKTIFFGFYYVTIKFFDNLFTNGFS